MNEEIRLGILVVDLDGTLLRSDMLHETFWAAFARDWRVPFAALAALMGGRAALKARLAEATVDVAMLPYDETVIAEIKAHRAEGGKAYLVTGSDQRLADAVAAYLGIFDGAHGSDGRVNLKGPEKARFLTERFGAGAFDYMGDAPADLPVWKAARRAITVNASQGLRQNAERVAEARHLGQAGRRIGSGHLQALRPHQWLKNLLVFVPMLAAHQIEGGTLIFSFLTFLAFCLIASGVYVLNDLLDLGPDRVHPRKRTRPFAAGDVPLAHGGLMFAGLTGVGLLLALFLGPGAFTVMVIYLVLTTAYSVWLKRFIVIDLSILAGLYTLRLIAGGAATEIPLSVWLLGFSLFVFFSLAAVKRQAELVDMTSRRLDVIPGRGYRAGDLLIVTSIALAAGFISVLVLTLYLSSQAIRDLYTFPEALWAAPVVLLYWITRTVMITHRGEMEDDPVIYAAKDPVSRLVFLIILAFALGASL